jgi:DNA modification methylase
MKENIEIVYRNVAELLFYENNARTHSKAQIKQIAESIKAFSVINPIIVDQDSVVVAGHGRLLAAKLLHLQEVPTICVTHLTEDEIRAYRLADNKIAANAEWDNDLLRVELEHLVQVDVDVDATVTGFSTAEIDLLFEHLPEDSPLEGEPPPLPDEEDTITQAGDLWQLGDHYIFCGDCRDQDQVDQLMQGQVAGMAFCDPPYNVPINGHVSGLGKEKHNEFVMASGEMSAKEFTDFLTQTLIVLAAVSKPGSLHFICMDWRHMNELLAAGNKVYHQLLNLCVWAKTNGGMGSLYRSQHELVFVYKAGNAPHINNVELGKHGRYRTNVWTYAGMNSFGKDRDEALAAHPTVKPIQLVADAILDASNHGDIIFDGFLGSGTTLLAAHQTGRRGYGVEIDPRYVDVAIRRWQTATGGTAIHVQSSRTFDEMAAPQGAPEGEE